MSDNTANLQLPYIMAAQAQKHVTHNEAIRMLDAVVQLSVLDRDATTPPASPTDGDRYIVGASATGDWTGKDGQIAAWQDNAWMFYQPVEGWLCWVADEDKLLAFDGSVWSEVSGSGGSVNPAPLVGINTTASDPNKLAVKSDVVLFSHDDITPGTGDIQTKLNKATDINTASFLFQTNWSGRAEIGLAGDDDFHFKVSPDGSSWFEAFTINRATGDIDFKQAVHSGTAATRFGYQSLLGANGNFPAAFGYNAGRGGSGNNQVAVGTSAGRDNTGGNQVAFGFSAGRSNSGGSQTAVGPEAGRNNTGTNNTSVGNGAGNGNTHNNATALGSGALNDAANQVMLGDSSVTQVKTSGDVMANGLLLTSDEHLKTAFHPYEGALAAVCGIGDEVVRHKWNKKACLERTARVEPGPDGPIEFPASYAVREDLLDVERIGVIAQIVEKHVPEAVRDVEGKKMVDHAALIPVLLAAVAELAKRE